VCTVLLRFDPAAAWPLLLAAVRDEFVDRSWDPPAAHWPDLAPGFVGGRDRTAGGTWLAVRTASSADRPAVAAVLNGPRPPDLERPRPTRGALPLLALTGERPETLAGVGEYAPFHLLLGTPLGVRVWSWNGNDLTTVDLTPGDHIVVNLGVDTVDDPLVPHFTPLLKATPSPGLTGATTEAAWEDWVDLLRGDGLAPDSPAALIERREFRGHTYGSTSASLVAIRSHRVRFDFTATPDRPSWGAVGLPD
jgi:hypothetical protein